MTDENQEYEEQSDIFWKFRVHAYIMFRKTPVRRGANTILLQHERSTGQARPVDVVKDLVGFCLFS